MKEKKHSIKFLFELYFNHQIPFDRFHKISIENSYRKMKLKGRELYAPNDELKKILCFIAKFIIKDIPIEQDVVYSYRRNKNVKDCLFPHLNNKFIYKTDIKNFFPSIPYELIKDTLLEGFQHIAYLDPNELLEYSDRIMEFVTIDNKLPIGFPTSPLISNCTMTKYDKIINAYCKANNFTYTRYSDDIIISSMVDVNKKHISDKLYKILNYGNEKIFSLNNEKTKVFTQKHNITILGLVITPDRRIIVPKSIKRDIEVGLFNLNKKKKENLITYFDTNYKTAERVLAGKIVYAIKIEPEYLQKLASKYSVSTIQNLIRMKR